MKPNTRSQAVPAHSVVVKPAKKVPAKAKIPFNQHDLREGSVIMRHGTVTPERMELESEDFCEGWDRIRNLQAGLLDIALRGAGWRMCFLGESLQAVALGGYDQETVRRAAETLLGKSSAKMFNCLEVTEIAYKHFLGVPYVHVTGHARHIQREVEMPSFDIRKNEIDRAALTMPDGRKKAIKPLTDRRLMPSTQIASRATRA
jgi:hypothetical protein